MTWTYDVTALATSAKDNVRLLIGDTDETDPQLQDEEIAYFLSGRPNPYGAAAECCRALAAKYARLVSQSAGDTKFVFSDMSKAYERRASDFEGQAANSGAGLPYAGGISNTDKLNQESDSDRVQPQFTLGIDDNFLPVAPVDSNPALKTGS
ncbi:hypothetical protein [Bradyrhizobium sp. ORS 86]|uniref:hypothetical protein n=1 Tax=Bradyrhizobium sp. ORS 86 TaxID=1685970 RepID=UPI00388DF47B